MKQVREQLDTRHHSWTRSGEVGVGIDHVDLARPNRGDLGPARAIHQISCLRHGPIDVEPARHQDEHLGSGVAYGVPRHSNRIRVATGQDVMAARELHHLGDPMPTAVHWIEPLHTEDASPVTCPRDGGGYALEAHPSRADQCLGGFTRICRPTDRADASIDVGERPRREPEDLRLIRERLKVHVTLRSPTAHRPHNNVCVRMRSGASSRNESSSGNADSGHVEAARRPPRRPRAGSCDRSRAHCPGHRLGLDLRTGNRTRE